MLKNDHKKKNIIITGAKGQDGIILSKLLSKKNYKIIGLVKRTKGKKIKNVIYKKINLSNLELVSKTIKSLDPKALIHFGSDNPSFFENKKFKKSLYIKNFKETKNLIDCFTKFKRGKLILVGSSQMYKKDKTKINLKSKFFSSSPYTKFRIDTFNYMLKQKRKYDLNMVMAILFNHDSIYRNKKFLIPRLMKIIKNEDFNSLQDIYRENISGDFSHADDICNGLFKLINSKKNPDKLIFSSNKRTYINDIIKYIFKINKIKKSFNINIKKKMSSSIGDNSFTKKILKWKMKKNIFIAVKELNNLY
jgi:GDPmannose 4,6-dehydratase